MCQGFSHFSVFLHHSVKARLATSSTRVKIDELEEVFLTLWVSDNGVLYAGGLVEGLVIDGLLDVDDRGLFVLIGHLDMLGRGQVRHRLGLCYHHGEWLTRIVDVPARNDL